MSRLPEVLDYLRKFPVFDLTTVSNKIDKDHSYTKLFMHRLKKRVALTTMGRNRYSLYDDPFLIASRMVWPSYISGWSALSYHHFTEQIPSQIQVITTKRYHQITLSGTTIHFTTVKPTNFFGYRKTKYENFDVFISSPEKALIDAALFKMVSFPEIREIFLNHIREIRITTFLKYLKKIGNKTLIKRFGFLLELAGYDYYPLLRRYINKTYSPLNHAQKQGGEKNQKWKVIIND